VLGWVPGWAALGLAAVGLAAAGSVVFAAGWAAMG